MPGFYKKYFTLDKGGQVKVAHVNTLTYGGAAIVARRIHEALLQLGIDSLLFTKYGVKGLAENHYYLQDSTFRRFVRRELSHPKLHILHRFVKKLSKHRNITGAGREQFEIFSPLHRADVTKQYDILNDVDIIHLHWINNFIDYQSFFKHFSHKKFVWTLHDMNPITGGCHHSDGCLKFQSDCTRCPQLQNTIDENYSNKVLAAKIKGLEHLKNNQLIIVSPSRWLYELSKTSRITKRFQHMIIPNPAFKVKPFTTSRDEVRMKLKVPLDKQVVLFASDNLSNPRKGVRLLFQAIRLLQEKHRILLLGIGHKAQKPTDLQVTYTGTLSDSEVLSEYFYCSDIFVTPSVAENSPLVVIESLRCGTPVVASNVGGIPDLINSQNGLLFPVGEIRAMAEAIREALFEKSYNRSQIAEIAAKNHDALIIAQRYKSQIYDHL